jgi:REP element-mobilizing transposase RayT
MGYHPRIETSNHASLVTTRTRNSELWLANNPPVEKYALQLLAKVIDRYSATLYAFAIEGTHCHSVISTPYKNRAAIFRDFNSGLARAVARLTPNYCGGRLWARRFSSEIIAGDPDIEEEFFYTVLQPIKDGLVDKLSEYPGYNCFHDAVCGIERTFKVVDWTRYNSDRRFNSRIKISDYQYKCTLKYQRLPGYENLTKKEYRIMMEKKLESRRLAILEARRKEGKDHCVGRERLTQVIPGTPARTPKISDASSHRPRVLSVCRERRATVKSWYFSMYFSYKNSSQRFRAGEIEVEFPQGMYRPPSWLTVKPPGPYSIL